VCVGDRVGRRLLLAIRGKARAVREEVEVGVPTRSPSPSPLARLDLSREAGEVICAVRGYV